MTEQKPLTAEEMTAWKAAEWHLVGLNPAQQLRLWATLDAERAKVAGLVDLLHESRDHVSDAGFPMLLGRIDAALTKATEAGAAPTQPKG